jgi:hypothetical protein
MASWVTEKIQSPFIGQGVSNVNQKNSNAIQHIPIVQWRLEMGACHMFLESPS